MALPMFDDVIETFYAAGGPLRTAGSRWHCGQRVAWHLMRLRDGYGKSAMLPCGDGRWTLLGLPMEAASDPDTFELRASAGAAAPANCRNCGAPRGSARCDYCGTEYLLGFPITYVDLQEARR
jgi:hypothetical protein